MHFDKHLLEGTKPQSRQTRTRKKLTLKRTILDAADGSPKMLMYLLEWLMSRPWILPARNALIESGMTTEAEQVHLYNLKT